MRSEEWRDQGRPVQDLLLSRRMLCGKKWEVCLQWIGVTGEPGTNVLRNVLQKIYACYHAWLLVNISIVSSLLLVTAEKNICNFWSV